MSSKTSMQKHPVLSTLGLGIPGYIASRPNKNNSFDPNASVPKQQGSANFYGNQMTSQTYQDPTLGTVTRYNPTGAEQQAHTSAQNQIAQILPTLGQTSPEMSKQYDSMSNAYADNATAAFNREYAPAQRSLREDYASRFGGGQNTPYIDAINDMETRQRVPALTDIANNAASMKQNLYNQGESQKLNELQGLGYTLNGQQANFIQNLQNPQGVTQQGNQFNQQNYQSQLQNYMNTQNNSAQTTQAMLGAIAAAGKAAAAAG